MWQRRVKAPIIVMVPAQPPLSSNRPRSGSARQARRRDDHLFGRRRFAVGDGALDRAVSPSARSAATEPEAIEKFNRFMRENVASGAIPFRKAYNHSVVDQIEVDDDLICIVGDKATPEQVVAGRVMASGGIHRRVPKWRTEEDKGENFSRWTVQVKTSSKSAT